MRVIGFLGLLLLAVVNVFGLFLTIRELDWKGIAIMLFMSAMIVFSGRLLWRGARLARQPSSGERLAAGWAGESVESFLRNQVAATLEGRILIAGSTVCFLMALAVLIAPQTVSIPLHKVAATAVLFGIWPILAFVLYVRVCGPRFESSLFAVLSVMAVVVAPFVIAYK